MSRQIGMLGLGRIFGGRGLGGRKADKVLELSMNVCHFNLECLLYQYEILRRVRRRARELGAGIVQFLMQGHLSE